MLPLLLLQARGFLWRLCRNLFSGDNNSGRGCGRGGNAGGWQRRMRGRGNCAGSGNNRSSTEGWHGLPVLAVLCALDTLLGLDEVPAVLVLLEEQVVIVVIIVVTVTVAKLVEFLHNAVVERQAFAVNVLAGLVEAVLANSFLQKGVK